MRLAEAWRLARRELVAYRTRSVATVVTVGLLFGLVMGGLLVWRGLEHWQLGYAGAETGGEVYLASSYEGARAVEVLLARVNAYGGRIVEPTTEGEDDLLGLGEDELLGLGEDELADFRETGSADGDETVMVVWFESPRAAYDYYRMEDEAEFGYNAQKMRMQELGGGQMVIYAQYRRLEQVVLVPVLVVLLVAGSLILALTMAHVLTQNAKTFVLYRTLGASRLQVEGIYLLYLVMLGGLALELAILVALTVAGLATVGLWGWLVEIAARTYPGVGFRAPILRGWSGWLGLVAGVMLVAVPLALLLCQDQFSERKLALKLKGD